MHIKYRLPALRNRLSGLLNSQRKELAGLGEAPSGEADDLRKMLISLITQYVDSFCTTIDGGRALTSFSELRGGARISHTFNDLYPHRLSAIQPTEALRPADIHTTIRNTKGARTALYGSVPQDAFEMLVKKLIRHLKEPAAWCVDTVFDELRLISEQVCMFTMRTSNPLSMCSREFRRRALLTCVAVRAARAAAIRGVARQVP
jgi:dynamin 1-like protein